MRRAPLLVLICGVLSAALGGVLLLVSDRVEGLVWLAMPVTALGLVLVGLWARSAVRQPDPDDPVGLPTTPLPGRWYPYVLVGVGVVLACWLVYWTKFR
jgi:hypothetical protein